MSDAAANGAERQSQVDELALRLYVELVGKTVEVDAGVLRLGASPEALAALSMKLAEAFVRAQQTATARVPDSAFELDVAHFAQWSAESARSARPQPGDDSVERGS